MTSRISLIICLFIFQFIIVCNAQLNCPIISNKDICKSQYTYEHEKIGNIALKFLTSIRYDSSGTGVFYVNIFNDLNTFTKKQCTNVLHNSYTVNNFYVSLECERDDEPRIMGKLDLSFSTSNGVSYLHYDKIQLIVGQTAADLLVTPYNNQYIGNSICKLQLKADYLAQDPCRKICLSCYEFPIGEPIYISTEP